MGYARKVNLNPFDGRMATLPVFAYTSIRFPGVPPEFMLLLLAVGWSIYLPAVSWLQWKRRNS